MSTNHHPKEKKKQIDGKGCLQAFGFIFFLFPFALFCFSLLPYLLKTYEARGWESTEGELISSNVQSIRGDDSNTYKVVAAYQFTVDEKTYNSNQVSLESGSDSFKRDHELLNHDLQNQQKNKVSVTVYYNPENPTESALSIKLRRKYVALQAGVILLFMSVGLGLMFGSKYLMSPKLAENSPIIHHSSSGSFWTLLFFTVILLGISAFLLLFIEDELKRGNYWILLLLIFPFAGFSLLFKTISTLREWMRFGEISLRQDPYPGSIGGDVAGVIDLQEPFSRENVFQVALACIQNEGTRQNSTKDGSTAKVLWQEEGVALAESTVTGTMLRFAFDVPGDLPPSREASETEDSVEWYLYLTAVLPGPDLNRKILINVQKQPEPRRASRPVRYSISLVPDLPPPRRILRITKEADGIQFHYPASRNRSMGCGVLFFSLLFGGTGAGVGYSVLGEFVFTSSPNLFGYAFALIPCLLALIFMMFGLFMASIGFHCLFNTKTVSIEPTGNLALREKFGPFSSTKVFALDDFTALNLKQNSSVAGAKQALIIYEIQAHRKTGKPLNLGDGLAGSALAGRVMARLHDEMTKQGATLEPLKKEVPARAFGKTVG